MFFISAMYFFAWKNEQDPSAIQLRPGLWCAHADSTPSCQLRTRSKRLTSFEGSDRWFDPTWKWWKHSFSLPIFCECVCVSKFWKSGIFSIASCPWDWGPIKHSHMFWPCPFDIQGFLEKCISSLEDSEIISILQVISAIKETRVVVGSRNAKHI